MSHIVLRRGEDDDDELEPRPALPVPDDESSGSEAADSQVLSRHWRVCVYACVSVCACVRAWVGARPEACIAHARRCRLPVRPATCPTRHATCRTFDRPIRTHSCAQKIPALRRAPSHPNPEPMRQALPATAEEYLRMVRRQARQIPDVVVAPRHPHNGQGRSQGDGGVGGGEGPSAGKIGGYGGDIDGAAEALLPSVMLASLVCAAICFALISHSRSHTQTPTPLLDSH